MNCDDIQSKLSEYLDKNLDGDTTKKINDHLASCAHCRAEVNSLARGIQLVRALPHVEPPAGFTARVMAHVRESAYEPCFWERLFFPFRIKLPIHATVLLLIGILAVYLNHVEPPQEKMMQPLQPEYSFGKPDESDKIPTPPPEQSTSSPQKERSADSSNARVQSPQPKASLPPKESRSSGLPEEPVQSALKEEPARAPQGQLEDRKKEAVRSQPPTPEPPLPGEPAGVVDRTAPAGRGPSSPELRQRAAPATLESVRPARAPTAEPVADYELVMRLPAPTREDTLTPGVLGARQAELGSSATQQTRSLDLARRRALQSGQRQVVWLSIPKSQYEQFKKELVALGSIESESSGSSREKESTAKSSDQLRIKITIVVAR